MSIPPVTPPGTPIIYDPAEVSTPEELEQFESTITSQTLAQSQANDTMLTINSFLQGVTGPLLELLVAWTEMDTDGLNGNKNAILGALAGAFAREEAIRAATNLFANHSVTFNDIETTATEIKTTEGELNDLRTEVEALRLAYNATQPGAYNTALQVFLTAMGNGGDYATEVALLNAAANDYNNLATPLNTKIAELNTKINEHSVLVDAYNAGLIEITNRINDERAEIGLPPIVGFTQLPKFSTISAAPIASTLHPTIEPTTFPDPITYTPPSLPPLIPPPSNLDDLIDDINDSVRLLGPLKNEYNEAKTAYQARLARLNEMIESLNNGDTDFSVDEYRQQVIKVNTAINTLNSAANDYNAIADDYILDVSTYNSIVDDANTDINFLSLPELASGVETSLLPLLTSLPIPPQTLPPNPSIPTENDLSGSPPSLSEVGTFLDLNYGDYLINAVQSVIINTGNTSEQLVRSILEATEEATNFGLILRQIGQASAEEGYSPQTESTGNIGSGAQSTGAASLALGLSSGAIIRALGQAAVQEIGKLESDDFELDVRTLLLQSVINAVSIGVRAIKAQGIITGSKLAKPILAGNNLGSLPVHLASAVGLITSLAGITADESALAGILGNKELIANLSPQELADLLSVAANLSTIVLLSLGLTGLLGSLPSNEELLALFGTASGIPTSASELIDQLRKTLGEASFAGIEASILDAVTVSGGISDERAKEVLKKILTGQVVNGLEADLIKQITLIGVLGTAIGETVDLRSHAAELRDDKFAPTEKLLHDLVVRQIRGTLTAVVRGAIGESDAKILIDEGMNSLTSILNNLQERLNNVPGDKREAYQNLIGSLFHNNEEKAAIGNFLLDHTNAFQNFLVGMGVAGTPFERGGTDIRTLEA